MHHLDGHPLADRRRDALDRAGTDVARCDDARMAGLEQRRTPALFAIAVGMDLLLECRTGMDEASLVGRDLARQPIGGRCRADEA